MRKQFLRHLELQYVIHRCSYKIIVCGPMYTLLCAQGGDALSSEAVMMLAVARRFPHSCQGPEKHRGASRGLALIPYLPGDVLSFAFPELGLFFVVQHDVS